MMTTKEMVLYDQVVNMDIATAEEINLVKYVSGGEWTEVLNRIIYARTGYRTIEQMLEEDDNEDYEPSDIDSDFGFDPYMGEYTYDC